MNVGTPLSHERFDGMTTRCYAAAIAEIDPACVRLAMQFVATWSEIELTCTRLVCMAAQADHRVVSAVMSEVRGPPRRVEALQSALAAAGLCEADMARVRWMAKRLGIVYRQRNRLCHYPWASVVDHPEFVVLVEPRALLDRDVLNLEHYAEGPKRTWVKEYTRTGGPNYRPEPPYKSRPGHQEFDRSRAHVYTQPELKDLATFARSTHSLMLFGLESILHGGAAVELGRHSIDNWRGDPKSLRYPHHTPKPERGTPPQ